eukprot:COSAG01_NODE_33732_length_559_cov_2.515217_1_plen_81_part_10
MLSYFQGNQERKNKHEELQVWGADRPVVTEIHLCLTPVLVKKYKEQTDAHHFCCRRPPAPAKQAVQRRAVDLAQAPPIHAG